MSYALSTTKRKFNRILDSISNTSSTSLVLKPHQSNLSTATLPTNLDSPAKKPRTTRPKSAYISSASQTASSHIENSRAAPTAPKITAQQAGQKKPHFTPWDRGGFLERLKTFRHVDKWLSKPEKINEVEWAKRGWTCVGKDRVSCVGCRNEVFIQLESEDGITDEVEKDAGSDNDDEDWRIAAQDQLVEKYAEMIITEHDEGCLWRIRGCDTTIYRLLLSHPQTSLSALQARYDSLIAMAPDLPPTFTTPPSFDLNPLLKTLRALLSPSSSKNLSPSPPLNIPALTLALFGWQAEPNHISGLATCNACFRRLGLWLFQSPKPPNTTEAANEDDDEEEAIMNCLNVVAEHRDYCPWINTVSQNGGQQTQTTTVEKELAGWEILARVVRSLRTPSIGSTSASTFTAPDDAQDDDDVASDAASLRSTKEGAPPDDRATTDAKDKERWAKLKRLKQVFRVKRVKGKETEKARSKTAG